MADEAHAPELVELDRDHPGFRDAVYRRRRNSIAAVARAHRFGGPVAEIEYTEDEHGVWRTALGELLPLHRRYACHEHLDCWPRLGFAADRIPTFAAVNEVLGAATGFRLEPVAGLVSPRDFMSHLCDGIFLATQYVRHGSTPLYTPEPDVLHELIGHAALLAHPELAALNRRFGSVTRQVGDEAIDALIRAYWYGLEFGVVRTGRELRVIGAGLLSSFGELRRFEGQGALRPFDLEVVARTPFDPTDYQQVFFVAESTAGMVSELNAWLDAFRP